MSRPKTLKNARTVQGWIEKEDWNWIDENYSGSVSEFVKLAIQEKIAREEPYSKEALKREIEEKEEELEKLKSLYDNINKEKQEKIRNEEKKVIEILNTVLEDGMDYYDIPAFSIKAHIDFFKDKPERAIEGIENRLRQIVEKTRFDYEQVKTLASGHVSSFKLIEDKLNGKYPSDQE